MIKPRLVLCSGATVPDGDPRGSGREVLRLDALGPDPNVNIRIEDVAHVFAKDLSPRLVDLLEIAAYVFSADCATSRGCDWSQDGVVEAWDRDFHFVIPVRDLAFWSQPEVTERLVKVLSFLTDDKYRIEFEALTKERPWQGYLTLGETPNWPFANVQCVLMFSGGLDSLAGAVRSLSDGQRLVLVSHRSNSLMDSRQKRLVELLKAGYPERIIHVPVWVNKEGSLGREHTQRSRSFLFAALGAAVAESVRARGIRFFENGILSLNLPLADEVLRTRASRTTHPLTLLYLETLLAKVVGRGLVVDNPFLMMTKAEVAAVLNDCGRPDLIGASVSCTHTMFRTKTQAHCGTCSQCIDRRVGILAAGLGSFDPATDYETEVFTGGRDDRSKRNLAVDYVAHAVELYHARPEEIAARYNTELVRAARPFPDITGKVASLVALHKRHGEAVCRVIAEQLRQHAERVVVSGLDPTSLLGLVQLNRHLEPSWLRLCERVVGILQSGLPDACKTHKPKDEPHLQQICHGLLKGADTHLQREFPFLQWAVVMTKPDWSAPELALLVELKYVRSKRGVRPITAAIAEDIVKYGKGDHRVLFLVYDPQHIVTDEAAFSRDVEAYPSMLLRFLR